MPSTPPRPEKLLDHVSDPLRLKHYSRRAEEAYVNWICRLSWQTPSDLRKIRQKNP